MEKLSPKRVKALTALLTEPTLQQAARAAGVGDATLYRWLSDPVFREQFVELRRQVVDQAVSKISGILTEIVQTLYEIALDKEAPASARVASCRELLERTFQSITLAELNVRISNLEKGAGYGNG